MDKYKISVIIPVFNVENYLRQCVDSVLRQTYKNLEIILVDDGSPDRSPQICDEYAKKDKRIKVIHKKNGGLASARNAGIDIAGGDFIGFVDSDDFIAADMYEILLDSMVSCHAQIAVCYKTNNENKLQVGRGKILEMDRKNALKKMVLGLEFGSHACDKLFKADVFRQNIRFPEGKTYEDLYTIYRWVNNSEKIVLCRVNKYYYRPNPDSITSVSFSKSNMNLIYGLENLGEYFDKNYRTLLKYQKMALAKSSSALLRKMIISESYDEESIEYLTKLIKTNLKLFLISPYKITSKMFTVAAVWNFDFAVKIYNLLFNQR